MLRAFHNSPVPADATTLTLSPDESHHLVKVLRANERETICAFDGNGHFWRGKMLNRDARALTISIEERESVPAPKCRISLAQAMPKGALMEDVVRQATEIGAAKIYALTSDHCEVKLDAERAEKKLERWRAIAVEACKQCGNAFVPEIVPVKNLREFLRERERLGNELWLVASLEAGTRFCHEIAAEFAPRERDLRERESVDEILWFVGPEGDFSAEEYSLMRAAGCVPARLGRNILRAVTAAIYTLTVADQMRIAWGLQ